MDENLLMNVIISFSFIFFVIMFFKFLGGITFNLTKEEIKNEKKIIEYLKKNYKELYPKSKEFNINRPHKKNGPWYIHIEIKEFNLNIGRWVEKEIRIGIFFYEESDIKIRKEKVFLKNGPEDEKLISTKCWNREGNEIDCQK